MSDTPTPLPEPAAEQPGASVVLDTNATVKKSHLGTIAAVVVVLGLVAFAVVYFATKDGDYTPGPVAEAVIDSLDKAGVDVQFSNAELKCIDRTGKGLDPQMIRDGSLSTVTQDSDPALMKFAGKMYDDCLVRDSRIAIFASGMTQQGGDFTPDQAACAAGKLDDAIVDAGGYEQMFTGSQEDLLTLVFGVMASFADCGIDISSMMGES